MANSKNNGMIHNNLSSSGVTVFEISNFFDSALDAKSNESPHSLSNLLTSTSDTSNSDVFSRAFF